MFSSTSVFCPQGEWKPREISNPAYKGKWIHPEIDNPEYTADTEIYKYDSIGVIGLDLWQVRRYCHLLRNYCFKQTEQREKNELGMSVASFLVSFELLTLCFISSHFVYYQ